MIDYYLSDKELLKKNAAASAAFLLCDRVRIQT